MPRLTARIRFVVHAKAFDVLRHDRCSPFAQRQVVFRCSALVAVPLDSDGRLTPFRQPPGLLLEGRLGIVTQRGLVVIEEGVGERVFGIQFVKRFAACSSMIAVSKIRPRPDRPRLLGDVLSEWRAVSPISPRPERSRHSTGFGRTRGSDRRRVGAICAAQAHRPRPPLSGRRLLASRLQGHL